MTIKIIPDGPTLELTASEFNRLQHEYSKAFMFYAGTVPTFEEWVRRQIGGVSTITTENVTKKNLLVE